MEGRPVFMQEFVDEFLRASKTQYAKSSYNQARSYLVRFSRFAGPARIDDFSVKLVKHYQTFLLRGGDYPAGGTQAPLSNTTAKAAMSWVRTFGEWLVGEWGYSSNPAKEVPLPKPDRRRRKLFPPSRVPDLFKACDRFPDIRRGLLAKAVIAVIACAGLRNGELRSLLPEDVDLDGGWLRVRRGKGGKGRDLPLSREAAKSLKDWMAVRTKDAVLPIGNKIDRRIWALDRRGSLGETGISRLFKDVCAIAGIKEQIRPHDLRHTFGTHLASLYGVAAASDALGHADFRTTDIYLHGDHLQAEKGVRAIVYVKEEVPVGRRRIAMKRGL